jgi:hypothetical protein
MWGTPSDLARFAIGVILAYAGRSESVLSQEMAIEMLTPQIDVRGLGPQLLDDGGDRFYFFHPGANEGYRNFSVAYPNRGQGVVIMTNCDNGEALYREILNSVSVEYGLVPGIRSPYATIAVVLALAVAAIGLWRRIGAASVGQ